MNEGMEQLITAAKEMGGEAFRASLSYTWAVAIVQIIGGSLALFCCFVAFSALGRSRKQDEFIDEEAAVIMGYILVYVAAPTALVVMLTGLPVVIAPEGAVIINLLGGCK